jgi:hypothetical protein
MDTHVENKKNWSFVEETDEAKEAIKEIATKVKLCKIKKKKNQDDFDAKHKEKDFECNTTPTKKDISDGFEKSKEHKRMWQNPEEEVSSKILKTEKVTRKNGKEENITIENKEASGNVNTEDEELEKCTENETFEELTPAKNVISLNDLMHDAIKPENKGAANVKELTNKYSSKKINQELIPEENDTALNDMMHDTTMTNKGNANYEELTKQQLCQKQDNQYTDNEKPTTNDICQDSARRSKRGINGKIIKAKQETIGNESIFLALKEPLSILRDMKNYSMEEPNQIKDISTRVISDDLPSKLANKNSVDEPEIEIVPDKAQSLQKKEATTFDLAQSPIKKKEKVASIQNKGQSKRLEERKKFLKPKKEITSQDISKQTKFSKKCQKEKL